MRMSCVAYDDAVTGLGWDWADVLVDVLIQVPEAWREGPVRLVRTRDACNQRQH